MKRQVFPPKGHVRWCRQYKPSTREDKKNGQLEELDRQKKKGGGGLAMPAQFKGRKWDIKIKKHTDNQNEQLFLPEMF